MTNAPCDIDSRYLKKELYQLGRNSVLRNKVINVITQAEASNE